ncbi:MAG: LysR family transcriptional regulator ArgP [Pseudomonas sp.]|jgi:LysR family transcriptional regulator (chromosome initiation inhibitor)|uniref:Transcriptional regulator ArgP n=1 Tax=Stutzerimonas degradans TaxID=2968968 RepID=A0A8E2QC18_9GAMM|nr:MULTISPECIES: LysR family transcriptional regulator ArgP [Pseudomonadaceae]MDT3710841.1 LysR family transcriptional regulator ArgP [Pseudomonadaceae bacterium]KGK83000.1 LysR family transcriptional regulator [Stutzerimonas degradans]MCQ4268777.1 LysR family transcriptional regulator ArgP [Stutzerimonas degradans]MCQ4276593.1 LysR family transcriptional regulator ArgP [Stutzerimonas degradans]MEB2326411.1 LysR family transcriptional regulator ArgP [Pseudomonas sp.]
MFDYKLLAALAAVVEQAGFERAAAVLGLSQSAVSQRIKLLEARVGQPVLLRGVPPRPTELGQRLLNHVQQVRLLERDLQGQVPTLDENRLPERLRIALNADSLATWWAEAVAPFCTEHAVLLDHVVEDQAVGLKRMRAGEVAGCVCAAERPLAGARSQYLGAMRYRALASPAFQRRYLGSQPSAETLARAPAIVFGPDDRLQHRYMASIGGSDGFIHHLCPSSEGFVRMLQSGLGWGLVPQLQVRGELARGELVDVLSGPPIDVPLYWHHWRNGGALLDELTRHLLRCAGRWLVTE